MAKIAIINGLFWYSNSLFFKTTCWIPTNKVSSDRLWSMGFSKPYLRLCTLLRILEKLTIAKTIVDMMLMQNRCRTLLFSFEAFAKTEQKILQSGKNNPGVSRPSSSIFLIFSSSKKAISLHLVYSSYHSAVRFWKFNISFIDFLISLNCMWWAICAVLKKYLANLFFSMLKRWKRMKGWVLFRRILYVSIR